jgi:hypothetical protein
MAGYYKHDAPHDPSMTDVCCPEMPEPTDEECHKALTMKAGMENPRDGREEYEAEMKKMMGPMEPLKTSRRRT